MVSRDVTFHESSDTSVDEIDVTDTSAQESTTPAEQASNEEEEAETAGDDIAHRGGEADRVSADILPDDEQTNAPRRSTRTVRPLGEWWKAKSGALHASRRALSARVVPDSYAHSTTPNQIHF